MRGEIDCSDRAALKGQLLGLREKAEALRWVDRRTLLQARNHILAEFFDGTAEDRARWREKMRDRGIDPLYPDLTVTVDRTEFSFLLVGDPGDGDDSQFALVAPLLAEDDRGTAFMVLISDIVYPAGDVNEYADKFYLPYSCYKRPIYGVPGNHDWYDGLNGFMFHFCGMDAVAKVGYRPASDTLKARLVRRLWRRASRPRLQEMLALRASRLPYYAEHGLAPQPGPYFSIATKNEALRIVAIDAGITGEMDPEQAEWLVRVSKKPGAKILLTGKPLFVDGRRARREIAPAKSERGRALPRVDPFPEPFEAEGTLSVEDVVNREEFGYVAAIGADVHNYQRYEVGLPDGRRIHHFVSGGGGAYLSATHRFEVGSVSAACRYPSTAESIEFYARAITKTLPNLLTQALALLSAGVVATTFVAPEGWWHSISLHLWQLGILVAILALATLAPALVSLKWSLLVKAAGVGLAIAGVLVIADLVGWNHPTTAKVFLALGGAYLLLFQFVNAMRAAGPAWRKRIRPILAFLGVLSVVAATTIVSAWTGWGDWFTIACLAAFFAPMVVVPLRPYLANPPWAASGWLAAGVLAGLIWLGALGGWVFWFVALPLWLAAGAVSVFLASTRGYKLLAAAITGVVILMCVIIGREYDPFGRSAGAALVFFLAAGPLWYLLRSRTLLKGLDPRTYLAEVSAENAGKWEADNGDPAVPERERRLYRLVSDLVRAHVRGPLTLWYSEFFDLEDPPLYKSFLRVDVAEDKVTIHPLKVIGTQGEISATPIEPPIEILLAPSGTS